MTNLRPDIIASVSSIILECGKFEKVARTFFFFKLRLIMIVWLACLVKAKYVFFSFVDSKLSLCWKK